MFHDLKIDDPVSRLKSMTIWFPPIWIDHEIQLVEFQVISSWELNQQSEQMRRLRVHNMAALFQLGKPAQNMSCEKQKNLQHPLLIADPPTLNPRIYAYPV